MKRLLAVLPALLVLAVAGRVLATERAAAPSKQVPANTAPSVPTTVSVGGNLVLNARVTELMRAPIVLDPAAADQAAVDKFLARAAASLPQERETIRATIAKASSNPNIATAIAARITTLRQTDFTATVTALGVLGELRSPEGEKRLTEFVALPLPAQGHMIEGVPIERTTLEQLQMKAVQGIAYAKTPSGDATVLKVAASHPSRDVRAEAIEAYLYNHGYSADAKAALTKVLQPADRVYLDRPHMMPGMQAADFNAQLSRYLAAHPNLNPPAPTKGSNPAVAAHDPEKESAISKPIVGINRIMIKAAVAPPAR